MSNALNTLVMQSYQRRVDVFMCQVYYALQINAKSQLFTLFLLLPSQHLLHMLNSDRKVFHQLNDEYDVISQLLLARFSRLVTSACSLVHSSRCLCG